MTVIAGVRMERAGLDSAFTAGMTRPVAKLRTLYEQDEQDI